MSFVQPGILIDTHGQKGGFVDLQLADGWTALFTGDFSFFTIELDGDDSSVNFQANGPQADFNVLMGRDFNILVQNDVNLQAQAAGDCNLKALGGGDVNVESLGGTLNLFGNILNIGAGAGGLTVDASAVGGKVKVAAVPSAPIPAADPDQYLTLYDGAGNPFLVPGWTVV